jgi:putative ABC transport system substrate-binding protein
MLRHIRFYKGWIILIAVIVMSLSLSGCGTQASKVYRVGIVNANTSFAAIGEGFKAEMANLGYTENIVYVVENPEANQDAIQSAVKKLMDDKVDVIVGFPALEAKALYATTQDTGFPAVFAYGQTEGGNLVKSVREPGGSLTGVRYPGPEMMSRRLEILTEMAPTVKRVWISYDKNNPNMPASLEALRSTASSLDVTLVEVPITTMEEFGADLEARADLDDIGFDAILSMPDQFNSSADGFAVLNEFATEHKIPLAGGVEFQAKKGALFINTTDLTNVGRLAAPLVDKILKGTAPGTIPVVTPEQRIVINAQVAEKLGITVPEGLLKMADEVIK